MLSFIRKALTSWPVLLLLGLIVVAFAVTGVGDPFGGGSGSAGGDLAKVGKTSISETAFLKQFDRVVRRARETNPGLTQQQVVKEGGVSQVLDGMIGGAAVEDFAARQGIRASDRAVDGGIASIDAFRVAGKFDDATYKRLLTQNRMSERELRDGLRSDLIKKQLLVPVGTAAQVSRMMAIPYARLLLDVHQGEGATIPPAQVAAPSEAVIADYYKTNQARFMLPERRGFRYAILDSAAIAAAVTVSDEEARKYFDAHREEFGAVEQRRLNQVVFPDEAKAQAFVAAVRGGQSFADAAQKLAGYKASDIELGSLSRDKYAAASNAALADTAFKAPAGQLVGPVKTDFGWNVVQVAAITPAKGDFASMKAQITTKLRAEKGEAALSDAVASIEDGLGSGKSFADVVAQHKLVPVTVEPVTRDGRTLGTAAALAPATLPVLAKAFDADPADGASVQELGKGQFAVVELGQVLAPAAVPLAQVRAQVVAAATADLSAKATKQTSDAVLAEMAKGSTLAAAMQKRGLPAPKPISGRRADIGSAQVPPALQAFLAMGAGATQALPTPNGSVVVVHKDRILAGNLSAALPIVEATRQQLAQLASDELNAAFASALEREVGVKRYPKAIAAATQRIVGEVDPSAK